MEAVENQLQGVRKEIDRVTAQLEQLLLQDPVRVEMQQHLQQQLTALQQQVVLLLQQQVLLMQQSAGNLSLLEILEEVPAECTCTATSSSSHTPNVVLPDGFKVELWESVEEEVMRDIKMASFNGQELLHLLKTRRAMRAPDRCTQQGPKEDAINFCSTHNVLLPVNTVLGDLDDVLPRKVHFQQGVTAALNKNPDFGLLDTSIALLLCGGEGKTARMLQRIHNIPEAFNRGVPKICGQIVPQVYSYTCLQGFRYAWLTDYDRIWVIKMLDDLVTTRVSQPLLRNRRNPSVRQVMFWLALKHMDSDGGKLPVPPLSSQVPASGQSGRGTQGGDAGSSSSGCPAHNTCSKAGGHAPAAAPAPQGARSHSITPVQAFCPLTKLGYGESGTVTAGRLNGRDVAIKFGDRFNSKDVVRRLEHEADVYGRLQHLQGTCIPPVEGYGLTEYGTVYFLATRLIKGSHFKEGGVVSHVQRLAAEQALTAIHRAGFLHGDIRPGNLIFVEATGKAMFLDLGFSKACACAEEHEAELQELRTMLTPSPTSVHAWPRSQGHSTDGAGSGDA